MLSSSFEINYVRLPFHSLSSFSALGINSKWRIMWISRPSLPNTHVNWWGLMTFTNPDVLKYIKERKPKSILNITPHYSLIPHVLKISTLLKFNKYFSRDLFFPHCTIIDYYSNAGACKTDPLCGYAVYTFSTDSMVSSQGDKTTCQAWTLLGHHSMSLSWFSFKSFESTSTSCKGPDCSRFGRSTGDPWTWSVCGI